MKSKSYRKLQPPSVVIAGIASFLAISSSRATSLYWDANDTAITPVAATGTWGTSVFWNTDSTGPASGVSQAATTIADDLFFSAGTTGTAGTVTVDTTQAANSITFDDGVIITVSAGTGITLGSTTGAGVFRTANTASTISTPITLGELGARTAYNFSNTGTGLLTIGAVTGTGTSDATTQTITVGSSSTGGITLNGIIADAAAGGKVALVVSNTSTGITTLSNAANTFSGGINLSAGITSFVNGAIGSTGNISFGGGTLRYATGNTQDISSRILNSSSPVIIDTLTNEVTFASALAASNTGGLSRQGAGTLVLSVNNGISGPVSLLTSSNGILRLDSGGVLNATTLDLATSTANGTTNQFIINGGSFTASGLTSINATNATRYAAIVINSASTADFNGGVYLGDTQAGGILKINGGTVSMASYTGERTTTIANDFTMGFIAAGGTTTISGSAIVGNGSQPGAMSIEGGSVAVGGSVTVFGPVQSNGQTSSLRVTGGQFSVADTTTGLILLTKSNATNTANVTFSGGTSTIEKITMAALGSNTGTMNLTLSGGNLYLGAGGLTTVATTSTRVITLQTGTLGADASWSSSLAMATSASASDSVTIKAADEANAPFDIALTGNISGAGNIVKTGGGTLTLGGTNTYTGTTTVNAGTLAGTGTIPGTVGMATATTLAMGTTASIGTLATGTVTLVSGTVFDADINSDPFPNADLLNVDGNLTLAGATLALENLGTAVPPSFTVFTIATYTGTLSGTFNGLPNNSTVVIGGLDYTLKYDDGNSITLTAPVKIGTPYDDWATANITDFEPLADATPAGDPDNDGTTNLAEFAFNGDPLSGSDQGKVYMLTADSDYVGDPSSAKELILTVAVRTGTSAFAGSPSPTAIQAADGVTYTIEGSTTLGSFDTPVSVVPTPVTTDLPAVGTGYEYRSFSLDGSNGLPGKGFIRAKATN